MTAIDFAVVAVRALALYVTLGTIFGVIFVLRGAGRVDPSAIGAPWGFRLLILPGSIALWPLLLRRWVVGGGVPVERTAHRLAAGSAAARRRGPGR